MKPKFVITIAAVAVIVGIGVLVANALKQDYKDIDLDLGDDWF